MARIEVVRAQRAFPSLQGKAKRSPTHTLLNEVWWPLDQTLIELHRGNSAKAIQLLEAHTAGLGQGSEFIVRLPVAIPERTISNVLYRKSEAGPSLACTSSR
jgi:hypothetical protein